MRRSLFLIALLAAFVALSGVSGAAGPAAEASPAESHGETGGGHSNPVVPVLLGLVIILVAAKFGGELLERIGQPAVLGELLVGVALGNVVLLGFHGLDFLSQNEGITILAELGVILLLFEVGLESNVKEMISVGTSSLLVAVLGVVAPFFLGWGVSAWLLPQYDILVHVFVGATLTATSVGITARVLGDLGKLSARESKVILGAAVIDDVLGLIILAVVSGIITTTNAGTELEIADFVFIVLKAVAFLVGALVIGGWLSPRLFHVASKLRIRGMLLTVALAVCFVLAYVAKLIDLEPIVGAFAAGLILDEVHFGGFLDRGEHSLEELLHPITLFLVPVFFVLTGIQVDLSALGQLDVLGFALLLSLVAIIGKMICILGVVERGLDRLSIAVGMVPRGEVGLIFAGVGASLVLRGEPVIDVSVFSAVVIMVMITTFVAPPALKITLARSDRKKAAAASPVVSD